MGRHWLLAQENVWTEPLAAVRFAEPFVNEDVLPYDRRTSSARCSGAFSAERQ
jgi:hypothetical protein